MELVIKTELPKCPDCGGEMDDYNGIPVCAYCYELAVMQMEADGQPFHGHFPVTERRTE
jgi:hypothetical protein